MNAPCYNCTNRHYLCHGQCEAYQKYNAGRKKISDARIENHKVNGYIIETVNKYQRYRRQHA